MIQSRTTRRFRRLFAALPQEIQDQARQSYRQFLFNPSHPGLHFKKLEDQNGIYSARIGLNYRALAVMNNDRFVWYWIGDHSEYDRLL